MYPIGPVRSGDTHPIIIEGSHRVSLDMAGHARAGVKSADLGCLTGACLRLGTPPPCGLTCMALVASEFSWQARQSSFVPFCALPLASLDERACSEGWGLCCSNEQHTMHSRTLALQAS